MSFLRDYHVRAYLIAAAWFAADQMTKAWASGTLETTPTIIVVPKVMAFQLGHNTGTMFSLFDSWSEPWRSILLIVFPVLAIFGATLILWKTQRHEIFARFGLALILGGATGNIFDRILHGYVVDFIVWYAGWEPASGWLIDRFGTNRWPTFNVADVGIFCGIALLGIQLLQPTRLTNDIEPVEKETRHAPESD